MRHEPETFHDTVVDQPLCEICTSLALLFARGFGRLRRAGRQRRRHRPGQERRSDGGTIARLKEDIADKGIKFFGEIDQSKLAADAGIKLRRRCCWCSAIRRSAPSSSPRIPMPAWTGRCGCWCRERQGRGLDRLYRFRLDRPAARHQGSRRAVQDGVRVVGSITSSDHDEVTRRPASAR